MCFWFFVAVSSSNTDTFRLNLENSSLEVSSQVTKGRGCHLVEKLVLDRPTDLESCLSGKTVSLLFYESTRSLTRMGSSNFFMIPFQTR